MDYTSQGIVDQEVRKCMGSQYCSYQDTVGDIDVEDDEEEEKEEDY